MTKVFSLVKNAFKKVIFSLRGKMVVAIFLGSLLAVAIYILVRFLSVSYIDNVYNGEEAKTLRRENYIEDLQTYIDRNGISSDETSKITRWVQNNRYVYLLIYKDNELFYTGGIYDEDTDDDDGDDGTPSRPGGGVTVDLPSYEEIVRYAEENGLHPLTLADGTMFASLADFTEYLYYDIANIASLVSAMLMLAIVMMLYFHNVTKRISVLAKDVNIVSSVDMQHKITANGSDELAALSSNVENMRSSILETLEKERRATEANAELITSMSHDIRTPLTVLLGYLDIMKTATGDEKMKGYICASEATALRLKDLSDDMFRYFLVFGGQKIEVELAEYDAKTLLWQIFSEHSVLLHEAGFEVKFIGFDTLPEDSTIETDVPKLMRVADNILSNINKYAERSEPVVFSCEVGEGTVSLNITNKIAADASTSESTGIGIKTCERLCEALSIGFEWGRRQGGFFVKLTLPVAPPTPKNI